MKKGTCNKVQKLKCHSVTEISYIYHISDIHIRLRHRHEEYKLVFQSLYESLLHYKNTRGSNGIVVITGDVFHSKIHLSPESIDMVVKLFQKVSSIMPTVIIAGNHDANLSNSNRMDSLYPIIQSMKRVREYEIYYLQYTGFYRMRNVTFGVTSVFGTGNPGGSERFSNPQILQRRCLSDCHGEDANGVGSDPLKKEYVIALRHGMLYTDSDSTPSPSPSQSTSTSNATIHEFRGYDLVLLGDIHKRQFVNKGKTMGYAGSLIQQHKGEHLTEHGFIDWHLPSRTGTFRNVPNTYGFYDMSYINHELHYPPYDVEGKHIPKKIRLYVTRDTSITDPDLKKHMRSFLKHKGVEVLSISVFTHPSVHLLGGIVGVGEESGVFGDAGLQDSKNGGLDFQLHNVSVQNKYIELYMKQESCYSMKEIRAVQECNTEINKQYLECSESGKNTITNPPFPTGTTWTIQSLSFDNLFSYGEGNFVDFKTMTNTVGFIGANHTGKSSLIDIILYALFDTCSRCSSSIVVANEILNHGSNWFEVTICLCVSDIDYKIKKRGVRNKSSSSSVKVTIDFWECKPDGTMVSLNGTQRSDTKRVIEQYIGTYENFITTSVSLQNNMGYEFIGMTTGERVDCLNRLLHMDIFDHLRKLASATHDKLNSTTNQLSHGISKEKDLSKQLADTEQECAQTYKELCDCRGTLGSHTLEESKVSSELGLCKKHLDTLLDQVHDLEYGDGSVPRTTPNTKEQIRVILERIQLKRTNYETNLNTTETSIHPDTIVEDPASVIQNLTIDIEKQQSIRLVLREKRDETRLSMRNHPSIVLDGGEVIETVTIPELESRLSNAIDKRNENQVKLTSLVEKCTALESRSGRWKECTMDALHEWNHKKSFYDTLLTKITMTQELLETMQHHTYDPGCTHCMNNPLVKKKQETERGLTSYRSELDKLSFSKDDYASFQKKMRKKASVDAALHQLNKKKLYYEQKQCVVNESISNYEYAMRYVRTRESLSLMNSNLETKEKEIGVLLANLELVQNQLIPRVETERIRSKIKECSQFESKLETILEYFEKIEYLNHSVKSIRDVIRDKETTLSKIEKDYYSLITEKGKLMEQRCVYRTMCETHTTSSKQLAVYENYLKIIQKNGIQYFMMAQAIPTLENRINNILRRMVDFTVRFDLEKKRSQKYIHIYLVRNNTPDCSIHLSSGFEKFLTNIAIKMGIRTIAKVPKMNMMMIDEGFGNFDEENISNTVSRLFDVLNHLLDYTIIISHIETLRDFLTTQIPILVTDSKRSYVSMK